MFTGCEGVKERAGGRHCVRWTWPQDFTDLSLYWISALQQFDLNTPGTHNSHQTVNVDIADQIWINILFLHTAFSCISPVESPPCTVTCSGSLVELPTLEFWIMLTIFNKWKFKFISHNSCLFSGSSPKKIKSIPLSKTRVVLRLLEM